MAGELCADGSATIDLEAKVQVLESFKLKKPVHYECQYTRGAEAQLSS